MNKLIIYHTFLSLVSMCGVVASFYWDKDMSMVANIVAVFINLFAILVILFAKRIKHETLV